MEQLGIVRRIDDLGRIVVPKELRKSLNIKEGDSFEIIVDSTTKDIILKSYDPYNKIIHEMNVCAKYLSDVLGATICITDKNCIKIAYGNNKKEYIGKSLSKSVINIIEERKNWSTISNNKVKITNELDISSVCSEVICPIISNSDLLGAVILVSNDASKKIDNNVVNMVGFCASVLGEM